MRKTVLAVAAFVLVLSVSATEIGDGLALAGSESEVGEQVDPRLSSKAAGGFLVVAVMLLTVVVVFLRWSSRRAASPGVSGLVGVEGWLLLLCVILVFVYPLALLGSIDISAAEALQSEYPRLATFILIEPGIVLGLIVYSIVTGARLWRVRPGSVAHAKWFLLIVWGYLLLSYLSIFAMGLPGELTAIAVRHSLVRLPFVSVFFLGWWLYLKRSKRVAATYDVAG